jgi:hypothetical protein
MKGNKQSFYVLSKTNTKCNLNVMKNVISENGEESKENDTLIFVCKVLP